MKILEVASKAGISVATVSRVFNTPEIVKPQTREHVLAIARELGYQPNSTARTLRTGHSRVLGVVLPTLTNPVFAECLQGIASKAQQSGYSILPTTTEYSHERETTETERLLAADVDGLVLVASDPQNSKALERIQKAEKPFVLAYNTTTAHACVSVHNAEAVQGLIERLVQAGHRHIGLVVGQLQASDRAQQRLKGYVQGMESAGLSAMPIWEVPFSAEGLQMLESHLRASTHLTAIVCSNDLLAIRTIRAASLAGLRVPADICVIGFDGIEIARDLTPSLASITQPNSQIGSTCVELLCTAIASHTLLTEQHSVLLPYGWRAGESCASLR